MTQAATHFVSTLLAETYENGSILVSLFNIPQAGFQEAGSYGTERSISECGKQKMFRIISK
jgi:hypothetical protein